MTRPPRLVRLTDDPATLPDALMEVWERGDAAIVAGPTTELAPPISAALAGNAHLTAGTGLVVPTSGSTSAPRAVVLSHAALAASTAASLATLSCEPGERWALALPLRHIAGLQVLARARALGTAVLHVDRPGDPTAIGAAASHAQHIALVPTQLVRCLDAGVDLRLFRTVLVGGGPLDPSRAQSALDAGVRLVQSYGMTETCGGCIYDGRPLTGVEVTVDDDDHIRLRGPMLASGYLHPSPEDAARFSGDGWFITDDLGRLDTAPDGETVLEVLGRSDDMINTGGVKVSPATVQQLVESLPSVTDVVIIGVPDPEWGERVRAVVVPTDGDTRPTLQTVRDAVTKHLPATHAPQELAVTDRIRRDELGKVTAAERARLEGLDVLSPD